MKRYLKITFFFFIVILSLVLNFATVYLYLNPTKLILNKEEIVVNYISNLTAIDIEHENIRKIEQNPKFLSDLSVSGWIPDWDMKSGIETLESQHKVFDSISPVYYFINPDGTLKNVVSSANRSKIDNFVKSKDIELYPAIQDFNSDNIGKMFSAVENIYRHNDEIIREIMNYGYDGIDLDYESIKLSDKDKFFLMLDDLSTKMRAKNKKLIFTVLPKWGDEIAYLASPQTRKVQDWKRISYFVDEIRIMTYELFGGNSIIGPIGPLEWLELNIKYAIYLGIPREKIVLGVHTYSYDWSDRYIVDKIDYKNFYFDPSLTKNLLPGVALYNDSINKIRKNYTFEETFNQEWGEAIGRYIFKGTKRVVVFPTSQSFEMRKRLAAQYGIKGIAYWKIGSEDGLKL